MHHWVCNIDMIDDDTKKEEGRHTVKFLHLPEIVSVNRKEILVT